MSAKLMNDEPEKTEVRETIFKVAESPHFTGTLVESGPSIFKIDESPLPVGDICVQDVGTLDPQPDITPLESVLLMRLFVVATANNRGFHAIDFKGFIEQHGLSRHFRKT